MNRAHGIRVVLLGGCVFAFAFAATGVLVWSHRLFGPHPLEPRIFLRIVVSPVVFVGSLSAVAFMLVTAAFSAWRSLPPRRAAAFSVPAGVLAFLFNYFGITLAVGRHLPLRLFFHPYFYLTFQLLIPGLATGLLAMLLLLAIRRIRASAT